MQRQEQMRIQEMERQARLQYEQMMEQQAEADRLRLQKEVEMRQE